MGGPTHLLFVGGGGMGSTNLVYSIRATGTPCVEKPNINTWYPEGWPPAVNDEPQKPFARLDDPPSPKICKRFRRTQKKMSNSPERFFLDPAKPLGENLLDYFAFLRSHGIACVLEARGLEGIVSRGGIRNVVFLIRDPIQSYVSFASPRRHGAYIDTLGGLESEGAIDFWGWSWNCVADEYLQAEAGDLDPVLIRYELGRADVARVASPFLSEVFAGFDPKRNEVPLSAGAQERIMEQVGDRYERIYGA